MTQRLWMRGFVFAVLALSTAGMAMADTLTWTGNAGLAGQGRFSNTLNWVNQLAAPDSPINGDSLIFQGFNVNPQPNNNIGGLSIQDITFGATAGSFNVGGSQLGLTGNITDNTVFTPQQMSLNLALNATPDVTVVNSGVLTLSGIISNGVGSQGLNKKGGGTLSLSGANTFTGGINVDAGILSIGNSDAALGAATGAVKINSGATLRNTASVTLAATRPISVGPTAGSGNAILNPVQNGVFSPNAYHSGAYTGATTLSFGGTISNNGGGTGGITKVGFGGVTLSGPSNYTGETVIRAGTVRLDFSAATAPTSNILYNSVTPGNLTLGGTITSNTNTQRFAALVVTGHATNATTQTFNSTDIEAGKAYLRVNSTASTTVNLGALSHQTGASVTFFPPASGNIKTTSLNDADNILGGWALVSTTATETQNTVMPNTFASVDGSGNIVPYTGYTTYTTAHDTANTNLNTATFQGKNVIVGSTAHNPMSVQVDTPSAATTTDVNTISFLGANNTGGAGDTVFIGQGNTLRLGRYGAIFRQDTGTSFNTYIGGITDAAQTGSGVDLSQDVGTLTAGGAPNTAGEIHFVTNGTNNTTGRLIVAAKITDNGTGPVSVIKSGPMGIKIDGHNTYTGGTYILEGIIQLAGNEVSTPDSPNSDGFGTGPVYVFPGAQFFANSNATFTNEFFLAGIGTNQENFGVIRGTNNTILTNTVHLTGDTRLAARGAAIATPMQFQGQMTDDGNGSTVTFGDGGASGNVMLNNATVNPNTWGGDTVVGWGLLHLGASNQIPDGAGTGNLVFNSNNTLTNESILNLNGQNETVNGITTIGNASNANLFIRNTVAATTSTLTIGNNNQSGTFRGVIQDGGGTTAVTKIGTGIQTLSGANTYTGPTNIQGGILAISGAIPQSAITVDPTAASAYLAGAGDGISTGIFNSVLVKADVGANQGGIAPGLAGPGTVGNMVIGIDPILDPKNVNFEDGGDLDFDLTNTSNDKITINGQLLVNSLSGVSALTISPRGGTELHGPYEVLQAVNGIVYSGPAPVLNPPAADPLRRPATYALDLLTDPNKIFINVTGGSRDITWTGSVSDDWDINLSTNWSSVPQPVNEVFFNDDGVLFDDTGANKDVDIIGSVSPGSITVNNSTGNDYRFQGPGTIAGNAGITKSGSGTLIVEAALTTTGNNAINGGTVELVDGGSLGTGVTTIEPTGFDPSILSLNATTSVTLTNQLVGLFGELHKNGPGIASVTSTGSTGFTGPVTVNAGTLRFADETSLGDVGGSAIVVADGATLDLGGLAGTDAIDFGQRVIQVTGTGVGGLGVIINSTAGQQQLNAFENVVLTGNSTFGGPGRFDIRNGQNALTGANQASLNLGGNTLTKTGTSQFSLVSVTVDSGNIVVNEGRFAIEAGTRILDDTVSTITVNGSVAGTILSFFNLDVDLFGSDPDGALPSGGLISRPIIFNGPGLVQLGNASNGAGQVSTVDSPITLNTALAITDPAGAQALILRGPINNAGGHTITKGDGDVILSGAGTHGVGTLFDILSGGVISLDSTTNNPLGATQPAVNTAAGGRLDFFAGTHNVSFVGNHAAGSTVSVTAGVVNVNASTNNPLGGTPDVDIAAGATLNIANGTVTLAGDGTHGAGGLLKVAAGATANLNGGTNDPGDANLDIEAAGNLNVTAGTATARSVRNSAGSNTAVADGAKLVLGPASPKNSILTSVNLNSTGTLDLTDGAMIVDYTGASPYDALRQKLQSGINLAGGFWDGTGIISSSALAAGGPTAIGIIEASDLALLGITTYADPQSGSDPLDADAVVLKYTYWGDADTDGDNDVDDFIFWSSGFPSASGATWFTGDFDYDGDNDVDDFVFWSSTFPTLAPLLGGDGGGSINAVPEPSTLALAAVALLALPVWLRSRRKN